MAADNSEGTILPPVVLERVDALSNFHKVYLEAKKVYYDELRALEAKFQDKYAVIFEKRAEVVNGVNDSTEVKGIPNFWSTAISNSNLLGEFIEEHDADILTYVTDIKATYLPNMGGFKVEFHFRENPYFTNSVLTLTIESDLIGDKPEEDDSDGVGKITGTVIDWKEGKNVTVKKVVKKGKKGKSVSFTDDVPSFFRFFDTPDAPSDDQENMMEYYQEVSNTARVAQYFVDKFVPEAVTFFLGEADDEEYEEDDEEYDDEEGEDEEDEDEEDDDDEDDQNGESTESLAAAFQANLNTKDGQKFW